MSITKIVSIKKIIVDFMSLIKKNEIFLLEEIVKKNFTSKYKDSILGIFWTFLSPLLMIALFTIIFSTLFKQRIANFPVYFLCAWCVFMFFTNSISSSMDSLRLNKNILQRTPAPKHIFVLGSIISEFLNFIITLIILVGVMIITHQTFYWSTIPFLIIPIISLLIMVSGLGLIVSIACIYYTDIRHLWTVLSMMLMYASVIFYPITIIPQPYQSYICLNPVYWAIGEFRCCVLYAIIPPVSNMLNLFLLALIILVFGIIIFKKYEKRITMKF